MKRAKRHWRRPKPINWSFHLLKGDAVIYNGVPMLWKDAFHLRMEMMSKVINEIVSVQPMFGNVGQIFKIDRIREVYEQNQTE